MSHFIEIIRSNVGAQVTDKNDQTLCFYHMRDQG